jgi:hypothetical protein
MVLFSAAGRGLVEECELFDGCETGETRVTGGYNVRPLHTSYTSLMFSFQQEW